MTEIGFIGLGTMGGPMAANIIRGGYRVRGFDIEVAARERHELNGGVVAKSAAEAVSNVKFVFTMLPNSEHVEEVLFGDEGIAFLMEEGSILIDMSTINPLRSDQIREKLSKHNISMIDAPIGRTSAEAISGKSLFMLGGEKKDIDLVRPIFELMGDTLLDCGGAGTGIRTKIVNNYMTTSLSVLTAETLTLARSLGLNQKTCIDVLNGTPAGRGHLSTTYPTKVLINDISPAFMIDLAVKDLNIGLNLASQFNVPTALGAAAKTAYSFALDEGRGTQDWTAIFSSLQVRAGLDVPEEQQ